MLFETKRLLVRAFTAQDLDDFFLLSSDPAVMEYIRAPMSKNTCRELLAEAVFGYKKDADSGRFAVINKISGKYAGNFLLRPSSFMGGTEAGCALLRHSWGKGYATEITKGGLRFAFEQLHHQRVYATTDTGNLAAQKVLLKCGFTQRPDFTDNGREVCLFEINNTAQVAQAAV